MSRTDVLEAKASAFAVTLEKVLRAEGYLGRNERVRVSIRIEANQDRFGGMHPRKFFSRDRLFEARCPPKTIGLIVRAVEWLSRNKRLTTVSAFVRAFPDRAALRAALREGPIRAGARSVDYMAYLLKGAEMPFYD